LGFTVDDVEEARAFAADHGEPFNYAGWIAMYNKHGGSFPVRIRAVPEGTVVPNSNILASIESTDPEFFWVVSWLETLLLRVWYPITVATQSYHIKKLIMQYLEKTSEDAASEIDFKLHDFGARGVSSYESSCIGGAAHLVSFKGSDNIPGVRFANHNYKHSMAGKSIPAAEHSTITMWGRENELKAYANMVKQYGSPNGLFACVSDSYNLFNAVENIWGKELRGEVINSGATLVVRPDSGNPAEVVLKTLSLLDKQFGSSYNSKMYKVLNHVRVLQGDGINEESIREILEAITRAGYSASNIAFGMGGALLQQVNRDTQKFAFKCSSAVVEGKAVDVYKDPITDPGKKSKKGTLDLIHSLNSFRTVEGTDVMGSVMKTVFLNGKVTKEYTLTEIRNLSQEF
jgi:nicotinamide phosphoribosyltransferase